MFKTNLSGFFWTQENLRGTKTFGGTSPAWLRAWRLMVQKYNHRFVFQA